MGDIIIVRYSYSILRKEAWEKFLTIAYIIEIMLTACMFNAAKIPSYSYKDLCSQSFLRTLANISTGFVHGHFALFMRHD